MNDKLGNWITVAAMMLAWAGTAAAVTDADKCQAAKLKIAGKYSFCRLKAEAKAIKTGDPVDYGKCDSNYGLKWGTAETNGGGMCPTDGDQADIQDQITADADSIALELTGVRFVDNGDGTVSDVDTGLMWEMKDDAGGIHDKDNFYTWSAAGSSPDGTVFTTFLATLNNGTSSDGSTVNGCFAGHCDWRLPTIAELRSILLAPYPCATSPCIDPIFGPTQANYHWSGTTVTGNPILAWFVGFADAYVYDDGLKPASFHVRAVRNGL